MWIPLCSEYLSEQKWCKMPCLKRVGCFTGQVKVRSTSSSGRIRPIWWGLQLRPMPQLCPSVGSVAMSALASFGPMRWTQVSCFPWHVPSESPSETFKIHFQELNQVITGNQSLVLVQLCSYYWMFSYFSVYVLCTSMCHPSFRPRFEVLCRNCSWFGWALGFTTGWILGFSCTMLDLSAMQVQLLTPLHPLSVISVLNCFCSSQLWIWGDWFRERIRNLPSFVEAGVLDSEIYKPLTSWPSGIAPVGRRFCPTSPRAAATRHEF